MGSQRSDVVIVAACLDFLHVQPRNFSGRGLVILRGYTQLPFLVTVDRFARATPEMERLGEGKRVTQHRPLNHGSRY